MNSKGKKRRNEEVTTLKKKVSDKGTEKEKAQQAKVRCFNCSKLGHKSQDCQQTRRERGSGFICGKTDHQVKDCPQKPKKGMAKEKTQGSTEAESKQIAVVEEQIFRDLTYKFENVELTLGLTLRTLLDSGSPISFIKESFIPAKLVTRVSDETSKYTGLNKSPLEIRGVTQATVEFEGEILSGLLLRVVPNSSIQASVIIGRDT